MPSATRTEDTTRHFATFGVIPPSLVPSVGAQRVKGLNFGAGSRVDTGMRALLSTILLAWSACSHPATLPDDAAPDVSQPDGRPVVTIASGAVRGTTRDGCTRSRGSYAAPQRRDALAVPSRRTVEQGRDASAFRRAASRPRSSVSGTNQVIGGSEDCLTLNVWTQHTTPDQPMPVIVFLHGGHYQQGSSAETWAGLDLYDGTYFAAHQPVVIVTINYRLGALGYLASAALAAADPDHRAGNYGVLDAIAALRWVQDNAAAFGGDPARVMVTGHSAGGYTTCDMLASPLAAGLFSRALIQSGGCRIWPRATALAAGRRFVQALGCEAAADVPACLRAVSAGAPRPIPAYADETCFPNVDRRARSTANVIAAGREHQVRR